MSATLLLLCLLPWSAELGYRLESEPVTRVVATLTSDVECKKLSAREWILLAAVAPTTAGQRDVRTHMTPAGKQIADLSGLKRPLLLARVPADTEAQKQGIQQEVIYEATLLARRLRPLQKGERPPAVEDLPTKDREAALTSTGELKHDDERFEAWVTKHRLSRADGESEIDFARRVFTAIRKHFTYEFQPEMDRAPAAVCEAGKSDCGGLSNLFVAALRAQQIPARTLAGRWATSASPEEKLNGHPYYQYHVKAEFFAAGVGWVPVDMASAILHDRSPEGLRYFGNDLGDFLVQHIDSNLEVDSIHFGKQQIVVLQRPAFWVTGSGSPEGLQVTEGWLVRKQSP